METTAGLFHTWEEADRAVKALEEAGFNDAISLLTRETTARGPLEAAERDFTGPQVIEKTVTTSGMGETAGAGALGGSIVGGLTGLLIGVGAIAIPGIGPVLAVGTLASALGGAAAGAAAGATAGGLLGALASLNIDEDETQFYAEGLRRGGILVIVHAREGQGHTARLILGSAGAADITRTTAAWREGGWERFDEPRNPENSPAPGGAVSTTAEITGRGKE